MVSYIVALAAFFVLLYNPLLGLLTPGPRQMVRTPRPPVNEELLVLDTNTSTLDCPFDAYSIHVFSRQPLVIYIESFLSPAEREHLLEVGTPLLEPSTITHNGGASTERDITIRDSKVAVLPRTRTVRCLEARALALQGWRGEVWVERLRLQQYGLRGHYGHHFDYSSSHGGWGRVSSFMVWVSDAEGALKGGGTEFPRLQSRGGWWCRLVECDLGDGGNGEAGGGVVFKPIPGNAVYWENFDDAEPGRGWPETWHAGLPVLEGSKVGLNIWSWGAL